MSDAEEVRQAFHEARAADVIYRDLEPAEASAKWDARNASLDRVLDRAEEAERALREAIQILEWCGLNDRSKSYAYREARPNGDLPGDGKVFNTPREFAVYWVPILRDRLTALAAAAAPSGPDEQAATEGTRWYVHCGCDYHGDHGGCKKDCQDNLGCTHELGVIMTALDPDEPGAAPSGEPSSEQEQT